MSTVFEAIIYPTNTYDSYSQIKKSMIQFDLKLKTCQFSESIGIILHTTGSRDFNSSFPVIAQKLSTQTHNSLLVLYDDRIGYRYSCMYTEGIFTKEFTPEDEVWVMVDEGYEPLLEKYFSAMEVSEDENEDNEYKTMWNAIELGLDEMGINQKWKSIFDSIIKVI
jgi:hypothetical protein